MTPTIAVIAMGNQGLSRATHSAYSYGHPRNDAVEHLRCPEYDVSARRAQPARLLVRECGTVNELHHEVAGA